MNNKENVINDITTFLQKHIVNQFPQLCKFTLGDIIDFIRFMLIKFEESGKIQGISNEVMYLYFLGLLVNLNQTIEFYPRDTKWVGFYSWTETEGKLTCEYKYEVGVISQRDYQEVKAME